MRETECAPEAETPCSPYRRARDEALPFGKLGAFRSRTRYLRAIHGLLRTRCGVALCRSRGGHMRFTIDPSGNLTKATGSIECPPIRQLVERDGYVLVEQRIGKCIVWLNSGLVTGVAEAALYYLMGDIGCVRFALSFVPQQQATKICGSLEAAIRAIADEVARHRRSHTSRFACRPVDIASVAACPPLDVLLSSFVDIVKTRGLDGVQQLLSQARHDRYLVVEHRARSDCFVLRAIGSGYSGFEPKWSKSAAGRLLEEQPDIYYASWLAQTYRQALALEQPVAQEVDAAIFRPDHGRRRFAYRRLLLPFVGDGEQQCLLSASVADPTVDLGIN